MRWRPSLVGMIVVLCATMVGIAPPAGAGPVGARARRAVRALPGLTWRSRGIGGGGAFFSPAPDPHDPDRLFVTSDMSGVYRTDDFGASWRMLRASRLRGDVATPVQFTSDASVLYAIDADEDLRRPVVSHDGGTTWSPLPSDPTGGEVYSLWADPDSTQRLLISSYDTLYFSSDGGATFHQVHQAHDEHVAGVFWDGDTILVGARDGLLVSTDGGATFSLAAAGGLPADEEMVGFAGVRVGTQVRLWAVTLGAGDVWPLITGAEMWSYQNVYRREWSAGGPWTAVGANIPGDVLPFFVAAAPGRIDTVWLAGGNTDLSAPAVLKSTDGGATWIDVFRTTNNANIATGWSGYHGDTEWWWGEYALGFAVSPVDPDRAVLTDLGFIHVTGDGGASWHQAYVDPADENPPGSPTPKGLAYHGIGTEDTSSWWLHWVDDATVVAALTDIRGIRSTDGGLSWTSGFSLGLPHNSTYHVVEHPVTGRLFAATSSVHDLYQSTYLGDSRIDGGTGAVAYSDDGGASWQILHDFGHPVVWLAFDPNDSETLYASVVHSS
ncbi:MAG TPA: hypothetical protein ENK19_07730, partial [Acidobacteria bacterium]|nr:hypothetical protein [Acidobacteriota bacterium]